MNPPLPNIQVTEDEPAIFTVNSQTRLADPTTKVYKYRWVIIFLFVVTCTITGIHWLQYSIISNVVQKYYSVNSEHVDWLSITFMVSYLPFSYHFTWLMDKKGLKLGAVLASALNCVGAWIKVVSVRPDLYYVTFIGQAMAGVGQVFALNAPSRLAAVWFGKDQVSSACSLSLLGLQLGVALGLLLPPIIVKPHDEIEHIGSDLSKMFYIMAGISTAHLLLVIFFFRAEPELPPSPGQATRVTETPVFFDSLKRLSRNRGFLILTIAFGVILGVFSAFVTVLNQMVLNYFPGHEEDAGWIGLTMMLSGMIGTVIIGFILDKTHAFKATGLMLYTFSTVAMFAFIIILQTSLSAVYVVVALMGFFMIPFLLVGYEFSAEITYPESEGTTAGIISASSTIFGTLMTLGISALLNAVGDVWSNLMLTISLLVGTLLMILIKQDLRRQAAHELEKREVGVFNVSLRD